MCYGSGCDYENSMGECRLPKGHLCPMTHDPEECREAEDLAEHYKEQAAEARAEARREARNG